MLAVGEEGLHMGYKYGLVSISQSANNSIVEGLILEQFLGYV